ncbi:aminodeoxychorismate/anthranilate synthase component II [Elizabethkingia meningoseptica]|uniref:Aminodeoxychorismate/anthranilate synthase component II n=1 Tax=Elizabethkingia meningoseptica TaxID=238 RepID=A0A1T3JCE7_ELIME|nr:MULTISPECIES: aminodeoxychorismate/anthranilate synthase component II [Elizabethkingia]AQX13510.1 aminodeoxychorismate/anthranilate synthase component II [Elizabethkingia meningoseptica]EJK5327602.1 aminodeoxychorismate/anthranilate synthase component II [Elizabethkingia meningoseptica]MBG0515236.1 aminodeoxychorismate/anthranilate synthase component II [Elizabethkingia meningoseptica]MDE5429592.1 aminodeoxychorismate/anthranilate synthase component II [Elizabethkingia meningoseptica]MDE543
MKILVFDNYDSFTYNLVQIIERIIGHSVDVVRNNEIALEEVDQYDKIILSPGPGIPSEAGILLDLIREYAPKKEIFGVCLGQQAIAEAFGGSLINLSEIYHGVATDVQVIKENTLLFKDLPTHFDAGRYHSWAVANENFPEELEITAVDDKGMIMALQHKNYNVHAVQFHPESILTPQGETILKNFLLN